MPRSHIDPSAEKLDEKRMPLCRTGELSALWKQGGLVSVREDAIDIRMKFESFADYWEPFLFGQGPAGSYVRNLDRHQLEALRDEVKLRLSSFGGKHAPGSYRAGLGSAGRGSQESLSDEGRAKNRRV